jgi:fibronectin type 3 domain-containing protein
MISNPKAPLLRLAASCLAHHFRRLRLERAAPIVALTAGCFAASGQTVPPEYQNLYTTLSAQISSFDSAVHAVWNGSSSPVNHAPQLEAASSALYTGLLGANYYTNVVLPQLEELQALGAQGIKVQVSFPILYEPFYGSNPSLYQSMAGFYQRLAKDIHARGLKLIVESTAENQFPGANAADFTAYYQTLLWNQYMAGRAENAVNTAQLMQPDYMSLVTEPDSEAAYTGQTNAGTVAGSTQLLQLMLNTLQSAGINGVSLGAGAGTWIGSLAEYIQSFAATSVQYIDIHVYLLNDSDMMNAFAVASTAHAAGKQVAISGLSDFKVADSEVGTLTLTQTSGRDPFSFWQPLDTAFFQAMSDFSNYEQVLFISPFWSHYFSAYLDYATYGSTPVGPLVIASDAASLNAELTGAFSLTGLAWLNLSIPQPDTVPPASPAVPAAPNVFATSSVLTWSPTTDNVGVAAYNVYRNGSLLATTSLLSYNDGGLARGTAYGYTLAAVDASGNISPMSTPVNIVTTTGVPPTVPALFNAQAASFSQINLSWAPSSSSIGVAGYEIYRGSSRASLTLLAPVQATSYSDMQVGPSLTYYYAVLAYDKAGNQSSLTVTVASSTPVEAAPSTPRLPVVLTLAYNQVSLTWPASTTPLSIGGYLVYRGTSPSSLTQISYTYVPAFQDNLALPATTYYYAVVAYDVDGLLSGQSTAVSVATPREPAPNAPSQLVGNATNYNQVTLSWSTSTSATGIWGYVVYRGTSPSTLSAIASNKTLTYTDNTARPSSTYSYAVVAEDTFGLASAQSSTVVVVTPAEAAPSSPSQLAAQTIAYNQVALAWTGSSSPVGLWGYVIYRGTSPSTLAAIGVSRTATAYTDMTTAPSTTYYYAALAYDTYGVPSIQSVSLLVVTPQESAPSAPSQLAAYNLGYNHVNLSWIASTSPVGLWGYVIYRGKSPSTLTAIGISRTTTTYSDTATAPSTTYYYAVVANDTYGLASAQSAQVSVVTPQEPTPSVPSGLTAQGGASNQVILSWSASSSVLGIGGYVIYRGTSSISLSAIGSSKTTSYSDSAVKSSSTYCYTVAAYDLYGILSAQSTVTCVTMT